MLLENNLTGEDLVVAYETRYSGFLDVLGFDLKQSLQFFAKMKTLIKVPNNRSRVKRKKDLSAYENNIYNAKWVHISRFTLL